MESFRKKLSVEGLLEEASLLQMPQNQGQSPITNLHGARGIAGVVGKN